MIRQSAAYSTSRAPRPRERPRPGPASGSELCTRCAASGTHWLTCPSLRLPPGYRLSPAPAHGCPCGLPAGTCGRCA